MTAKFRSRNLFAPVSAILISLLPQPLLAQSATQNITLVPGWNAIWLEVAPVDSEGLPQSPDDIFGADASIIRVLSPKLLAGTAEFFAENPSDVTTTFNQPEWEQWNRSEQLEANLAIITGNRPYLIKATQRTVLSIDGSVRFYSPTWAPDRYNLVGFALEGSPTFAEFFEAAGDRHPTDRIYRLTPGTGNWVRVSNPATEMRSNEAYWVFASGPSNYMGPVAVDFDGAASGILSFGGPADVRTIGNGASVFELDLEEVTFTNLRTSGTAVTPALDLINSDNDSGNLTLRTVRPDPNNLGYIPGNLVDTAPGATASPSSLDETVEQLSSTVLTLGAARDWDSGPVGRTNVYRLRTGAGSVFWLPVTALLNSIQPPTGEVGDEHAAVAGLWVGEASVTGVTSFVEDGGPVRKAAAPAPLLILLHSDGSGIVNLLSQVTLMQTKTADSSIPSDPVLVVDRDQIPFFEGIKERKGKRVGLRLESVAFDMPRDTSIASQSDGDDLDETKDLIDMIVAESESNSTTWLSGKDQYPIRADVDPAAIDSYLLFRGLRPPTLKEVYLPSLRCDDGAIIGAGKTVRTRLVLDGFHRSNPFRHTFHQKHAKGPKITRELCIVFDSEQAVPDRLVGTYEEKITGLTKSRITLTGTIKMERVSSVDSLQGAPVPAP
jgi:hypothetical protein